MQRPLRGRLGMAPGANIGDKAAIFEATHGTVPNHAGLDRIKPGSVILSGVMMLEFTAAGKKPQISSPKDSVAQSKPRK